MTTKPPAELIDSTGASSGDVITADGSGGSSFQPPSGGGSSAFSALTTSTNTTATMTVGTGASMLTSGSGTITATAAPLSGISGLGTNVGTFLATPSSANLRAALTDETGTGLAYFQGGDIGTPSAGVATNLTGTAAGLTAGSATTATTATNISTANETGDSTCFPVFVTASGTQSSIPGKTNSSFGFDSTNGRLSTAGLTLSGLTVSAAVATDGSKNLVSVTNTGTGNNVLATSPTLATPVLGAATATSVNGLIIDTTTGTFDLTNGKTLAVTNSMTLTGTDGVSLNVTNVKPNTVGFTASGTVATGKVSGFYTPPYAGTITGYRIMATAGTVTVRTWKVASGTTAPTVSNNISTAGVSLSSGTAIISNTVTDFTTTTVTADDMFAFEITAVSGVTDMTFELIIGRT